MKDKNNKDKSNMDKLSQPEKAHIEELLKNAMQDYAVRQHKQIKDREALAETITSIVSEYLDTFMIIGYDTKGQPFNLINARSQMDLDAITTAINKFIFNIINPNQ